MDHADGGGKEIQPSSPPSSSCTAPRPHKPCCYYKPLFYPQHKALVKCAVSCQLLPAATGLAAGTPQPLSPSINHPQCSLLSWGQQLCLPMSSLLPISPDKGASTPILLMRNDLSEVGPSFLLWQQECGCSSFDHSWRRPQ